MFFRSSLTHSVIDVFKICMRLLGIVRFSPLSRIFITILHFQVGKIRLIILMIACVSCSNVRRAAYNLPVPAAHGRVDCIVSEAAIGAAGGRRRSLPAAR